MFIYPIFYHNWRNISTIYIYNKTSIKQNILTINKIHRELGRAKDLSAPMVQANIQIQISCSYSEREDFIMLEINEHLSPPHVKYKYRDMRQAPSNTELKNVVPQKREIL
jgi:hypothetical protein